MVTRIATDPKFANSYSTELKKDENDPNGEDMMNSWLLLQGFDTTISVVQDAYVDMQKSMFLLWAVHPSTKLKLARRCHHNSWQ